MKRMKKIFKITGISLAVLLLLALLIPILFKKQVQALVKKEINKQLNATVDFKDVSLSLFRHFPRVTISIKGLSVVGTGEYAADTLIAAQKLEVTAGLFSVLKGKDIKVNAIYARSPRIHLLNNRFGRANWDIAKPSSSKGKTDTSASNFKMTLTKYEISNGFLEYEDEQAHSYLELYDLNHMGSGNLTADVFTLSTVTKTPSAYFTQDNIPYLNNTNTDLAADIKIDTRTNTYTFKTDDVKLNALKLSVAGFVQTLDSGAVKTDITFSSPTNDFKNILSMIPAVYTKDFANIKTSGQATFKGFVKGISSKDQLPGYDIDLVVKNGSFQYPDLPKPVKNINLTLKALNPDGKPDHSVIDIPRGHVEFDNEPFDFNFTYKNPETIQYIDAGAKGKLDLSQVSKFIKLEKGTQLSGQVWADAFAKGPLKALQQQSGPFTAGGFFDIRNLFYSGKDFPQPVKNGNIKATLTNSGGIADNTVIDISSAHIELGNDPVDFSLQLKNPVTAQVFSGHAKGKLMLDHLKQFTTLPAGTSLSGVMNADMGFAGSSEAIRKEQYDKILLNGSAAFANVNYTSKDYPTGISIPSTTLSFKDKTTTLSDLTAKYLNTRLTASGTLTNLTGFLAGDQPLTGTIQAKADQVNLNEWMGTAPAEESSVTAAAAAAPAASGHAKPFLVPADMNLTVNAAVNSLRYDKVDYNNITGALLVSDEKITLKDIRADALEGNMLVNGSYSTRLNKEKPDISLSYDVKDMDIQKVFNSFVTVKFLMPIGKFLSGKLQSQLSLTGNLKGDMMPLLNSLTGKGNLLLLQGVLAKFKPLEKIATLLDIDRLKSISVKDIKNYIEFSNGKVLVKPFTIKVEDIEMEIAGLHGFDESIDYNIKMKLPRSKMGSKGNALVNDLVAKATATGLPIKLSDMIDLNLKVTGSIDNPAVSVNLKDMAGDMVKNLEKQALDFAKARADSLKKKALDSLNILKILTDKKAREDMAKKGIDTALTNVKNEKDSVFRKAADTLRKKTVDSLKKKIRNILSGN